MAASPRAPADPTSADLASASRHLAERDALVSALEAVAGGVVVHDVATRTVRANAAALALFGVEASFMELPHEQRLAVLQVHHEDGTPWPDDDTPLQRALRGETVREVVARMRAADGRPVWVCVSAVPVRLGEEITGVIVTLREVSERVRQDQELLRARDAAEAASRAKSAFLANMSHEVRTPMHAILGYAQVLLDDPAMGGAQREGVEVIFRSSARLLSLLNDVLDVSRTESRLFAANRAELDLAALVERQVQVHAPRAAERGLALTLDWSPGAPRQVIGDEEKLERVLASLLGNALKFTERGGATLAVATARRGPGGRQERLVVSVRDTGPGIDAGDLELLFRPFAQTRVGIEAHGGMGLGLALSRELSRLMGGDLTAASDPGVGSTFTLEIPLERGGGERAAPAKGRGAVTGVRGEGSARRVLVAEDDENHSRLVCLFLRRAGFTVHAAADGQAALEAFDAWHPHLVLLDMDLPVLDGLAVARALRGRAAGRATPIVALTGRPHDGLADAGLDEVLIKPCPAADILEAIRVHLGLEYTYEERAPGRETPSQPPSEPRPSLSRCVPAELLEELRTTVQTADYFRMMEILAALPAEAAGELRALGERYDYAAIAERLGE